MNEAENNTEQEIARPVCAAFATSLALARTGALSPAEREALRVHLAECAFCRADLAAYDEADAALRRHYSPQDRDASFLTLDMVREGVTRDDDVLSPPAAALGRTGRGRRLFSSIAAVAAVLLMALLAQVAFSLRAPHPGATSTPNVNRVAATPTPMTPVPTVAVPPAGPLVWQSYALPSPPVAPTQSSGPSSTRLGTPTPGVAVAQSDANVAYECAPIRTAGSWLARVWVTRDRGAHWTHVSDIVPGSTAAASFDTCKVVVDTSDPSVAVVRTFRAIDTCGNCAYYGGGSAAQPMSYVTQDFGKTWQADQALEASLAPSSQAPFTSRGPYPVAQLTTYNGAIYALHLPGVAGHDMTQSVLLVSRDRMRTWTQVPQPPSTLAPPSPFVEFVPQFWINPVTGEMLALQQTNQVLSMHFWTSRDGGQSWTQLKDPPFEFETYGQGVVVQQPYTDQPWHICGTDPGNWFDGKQHNPHQNDVTCTSDGGATWVTRHLDLPLDVNDLPIFALAAIADDGSVLLTTPSDMARLAPGSSRLEPLGPLPSVGAQGYGGTPVYAAGRGAGVLWSWPFYGYTNEDLQGDVFTAAYA